MRSGKGLEEFCRELASPEPSPGGGTAAAAAGAVAASLLSMVCGVTLKNKRHEHSWEQLRALRTRADELAERLLSLAEEDAAAYDRMVETGKAGRQRPGDEGAAADHSEAVARATEVPMRTAESCAEVLELAGEVGRLGTRSASSDVDVARHLAVAGAKGGLANVMINLPYCTGKAYADEVRARAKDVGEAVRSQGGP